MSNDFLKIYYWADRLNIPGEYIRMFLGLTLSIVVTLYLIPKIIWLAKRKRILAEPNLRSSHNSHTPNLGGVAIFYALTTVGSLFAFELFERYKLFFASLIILFFTGLLDDLLDIKARSKLYAQIIAVTIFVIGSDVRITSFNGLFGIQELNLFFSFLITVGYFIFLINAVNLIDGIDGLAGGLLALTCSVFGLIFIKLMDFPMAILCAVLLGSCLGFLFFNLRKKRKIFMGDTGSLVLGFCLAFFSIRFMNLSTLDYISIQSGFILALAIVALPLIDTIQVLVTRIKNKQGLFKPDKNHLHHLLLQLRFTHKKAALTLLIFQITIIALAYFLRNLEIHLLVLIILTYSTLFVVILHIRIKRVALTKGK